METICQKEEMLWNAAREVYDSHEDMSGEEAQVELKRRVFADAGLLDRMGDGSLLDLLADYAIKRLLRNDLPGRFKHCSKALQALEEESGDATLGSVPLLGVPVNGSVSENGLMHVTEEEQPNWKPKKFGGAARKLMRQHYVRRLLDLEIKVEDDGTGRLKAIKLKDATKEQVLAAANRHGMLKRGNARAERYYHKVAEPLHEGQCVGEHWTEAALCGLNEVLTGEL